MGGPSSPKILYPEWQNEYQVALLELDRKKLLERVTAAETAIFNRIKAHFAESCCGTPSHRRCASKLARSQAG